MPFVGREGALARIAMTENLLTAWMPEKEHTSVGTVFGICNGDVKQVLKEVGMLVEQAPTPWIHADIGYGRLEACSVKNDAIVIIVVPKADF